MSANEPRPVGVSHVSLRVRDLEASRRFYQDVLGFDVERSAPDRYRFWVGATRIILRPPLPGTAADDRFSERRIGLDHLALAVDGPAALDAVLARLRAAGVPSEGIQELPQFGACLVCFRDPDNVQWEFYTDQIEPPR